METPYLDKMIDNLQNHIDAVEAGSYAGISETKKELAEYEAIKHVLISRAVSSAMYKAVFSFQKYSPRGGNGYWTTEIVPIQAKDETELKEKIATYQANDHNGYHKHIKLTSIELM